MVAGPYLSRAYCKALIQHWDWDYSVYLYTCNLPDGLEEPEGIRCLYLCRISHRHYGIQTLPFDMEFDMDDVPLRGSQKVYPTPDKLSSPPAAVQYATSSGIQSVVSGQELEFITLTGPPSERSQTSRDIVRSHVMRSFFLEKNGKGRAGPELDADIDERGIGELKGKFKLATWSRRKSTKQRKVIVPPEKTLQRPVSSSTYDIWDPERLGCTVRRPQYAISDMILMTM